MSHWHMPPGRQPLRPIPVDKLPEMIGDWVSFDGPAPGQRYRLEAVSGDRVTVSVGAGRGREVLTRPAAEVRYPRAARTRPTFKKPRIK